jgi:hypothetical protein
MICQYCGKEHRNLSVIAFDIQQHWPKINYAAKPYLSAMASLDCPSNNYGYDNGADIVQRFLFNASTWRGEDARRIKAELKALI